MNILSQVVEDRHYLEAQKDPLVFSIKNAMEKKNMTEESSFKIHAYTLEDILNISIRRGLFWRYLKTMDMNYIILCHDRAEELSHCPIGTYKTHGIMRVIRDYLCTESKLYIGSESDSNILLELKTQIEKTQSLEELIKFTMDKLRGSVDSFLLSKYGKVVHQYDTYSKKVLTSDDYERLRVLGEGGFGKVHAIRMESGAIYAAKEMSKARIITKKRIETVLNEAKILKKCHSTFICRLHHIYSDDMSIYFILDIMFGGELKYQLKRMEAPREDVVQFWMACLISGIHHLHSNRIIHRDIKLSNALLDSEGYVCINDFGLSVTSETEDPRAVTCCGTPGYVAPEMYLGPHWDSKRSKSVANPSKKLSNATSSFLQKRIISFRSRGTSVRVQHLSSTKDNAPILKPLEKAPEIISFQEEKQQPPRESLALGTSAFESLQNSKFQSLMKQPSRKSLNTSGDLPRYKDYGYSVDWFACGVALHQMFSPTMLPFSRGPKKSQRALVQNMVQGVVRWSDASLEQLAHNKEHAGNNMTGLTPDAHDLVLKLLHHAPDQRIGCGSTDTTSFTALKNHPFFNGIDWQKLENRSIVAPFRPPLNVVNAEFQESEWDASTPTKAQRRKSVKLVDEFHAKVFKELEFVRPETFYEQLADCEIAYDMEVEEPKDLEQNRKPRTSGCCVM